MIARFDSRLRLPGKLQFSRQPVGLRSIALIGFAILLLSWLIYHHLWQPNWVTHLPPMLDELVNLLESAAILTFGLLALFVFWRGYLHGTHASRNVTIDDLYELSPNAFERYVAELFQKKGYDVIVRGRSGDHGVDLELTRSGNRRAIVQCKRYRNSIGPDIVRELYGTMIHERVHHAFLVTTAGISPSARKWARNKPITLIDGRALVKIARSLGSSEPI
jgi:HJR/Mrr/RecB family endonuclease